MKKLLVAFCFMLIGASGNSIAQSSWYKYASLPDGGAVMDMAADNTGAVYVLTSIMSDIFYTADNGISWNVVAGTHDYWNVTDIEVDKGTGTLYVGTVSQGLHWTSDKGLHWSEWLFYTSSSGAHAFINATARKKGTNIIVCNEPGISGSLVYKSTTAGAGFTSHAAVFSTANDLEFMQNGTLLAGTENGVFRSLNNGQAWTVSNTGVSGKNIVSIVEKVATNKIFAAAQFNYTTNDTTGCGVYVSVDSGFTWSKTSTGITDGRISCVALDSPSGMLYAASHSGIYRSADDGSTWTAVNTGLNGERYTSVVATATGVFSGNMQSGCYYSNDPSTGWINRNNGLTVSSIGGYTLSDSGDMHLLDIGYSGVYRKAGSSWTAQHNGLPAFTGRDIAEDKNGVLYAAIIHDSTGLYRSADHGVSWTNIAPMPAVGAGFFYYVSFGSIKVDRYNNLFVIADYSGSSNVFQALFRSTDGGSSWTELLSVTPATSFFSLNDVEIASDSTIYVVVNTMSGLNDVLYSTDWGITFSSLPSDLSSISNTADLVVGHDDSVYIVQDNHIYKHNGIGHWAQLADGGWDADASLHPIKLNIDTLNKLYVTCRNYGVFSSANGIVWSDISTGIPTYTPPFSFPCLLFLRDIQFDGDNTPHAIATEKYSGGLRGLYKYGTPPLSMHDGAGVAAKKVSVHPNPVVDECGIYCDIKDIKSATFRLYDATGKLIADIAPSGLVPGANNISIDMREIAAGVYFLKAFVDGGQHALSIIKQ